MRECIDVTGTDVAILGLIQRFPFISTLQLMRLRGVRHLPTMQAKMKELVQKGLLVRRRLPNAAHPASSEFLYHISTLGRSLLDVDSDTRSRSGEIAEGFIHLNHAHTLNDVLISAYLLPSAAPGIILSAFRSDLHELKSNPITVSYECAFPTGGTGKETTTIIPDAWLDFRLDGTDKRRVYVVELDMGSMDNMRLRRKMRAYYHLGVSDEYFHTFSTNLICVVYIALSEKRRDLLRSLCEQELQLQGLEEEYNLFRFGVMPASADSIKLWCSPTYYRPYSSAALRLLWQV